MFFFYSNHGGPKWIFLEIFWLLGSHSIYKVHVQNTFQFHHVHLPVIYEHLMYEIHLSRSFAIFRLSDNSKARICNLWVPYVPGEKTELIFLSLMWVSKQRCRSRCAFGRLQNPFSRWWLFVQQALNFQNFSKRRYKELNSCTYSDVIIERVRAHKPFSYGHGT